MGAVTNHIPHRKTSGTLHEEPRWTRKLGELQSEPLAAIFHELLCKVWHEADNLARQKVQRGFLADPAATNYRWALLKLTDVSKG